MRMSKSSEKQMFNTHTHTHTHTDTKKNHPQNKCCCREKSDLVNLLADLPVCPQNTCPLRAGTKAL